MRKWLVTAVVVLGATFGGIVVATPSASAVPAGSYEALTPARVLDTRTGTGHTGKAGAGETIVLDVTGDGGVPQGGVSAVVLNVTATEATDPTFVTVFPGDQPQPNASNLNAGPGSDTANLVIATVAADGTVSLFNFAGAVHLVADVTGWFPAASSYSALTPARVLDTRSGLGAPSGPVPADGRVSLRVTGVAGVPSTGVGAVVVNVTATNITDPTFVTVWPGDQPRPNASNLNGRAGVTTPNLVVATVAADGTINLYNYAGTVDLIADVTGWFPIGSDYKALTPARVLDTRISVGATGPVGAGQSIKVDVTGAGGVPEHGVAAVVLNVTGTQATEGTFVTVWPGDQTRPVASNLNLRPGIDTPNLVIATVAGDGTVDLFNYAGTTELVADVMGWLPTSPAGTIEAGIHHTCARRDDGTVRCWGYNGFGQLGDGTTTDRLTPTPVAAVTSAIAVAAGEYHSCALLEGGTVSCWGYNEGGQLGNGGTANSSSAVAVPGLSGATALVTGAYHTCALRADGTVACWGFNEFGQLGNGTTTDASSPATVSNLTGVAALSGGGYHTCATLDDGTARCWGANESGQLGNGSTAGSAVPVPVSGLSSVSALAAGGYHSCALITDGTARCWGANDSGQLGHGATTGRATPVTVAGLAGAVAVSAGDFHSCAVIEEGSIRCWGENGDGQLGNGSTAASTTPVPVAGITTARDVSAGTNHTCAVLDAGAARCWGANSSGQLGDGTTTGRLTPVMVIGG